MDTPLAMILMTATFVLGAVYGALPKIFTHSRTKDTATETKVTAASKPIDATFVALFSTCLPRYNRAPCAVERRVPENIYWIEAETDN